MATYTVTLSNAEDKAIHVVAMSAQDWIDNAVHERCRIAMEEIIAAEVKRLLDAGEPIPSSRDEIVLAAPVKSGAERDAEVKAAQAARFKEKTQG
jgi:hypothetical protein